MVFRERFQSLHFRLLYDCAREVLDMFEWDPLAAVANPNVPRPVRRWIGFEPPSPKQIAVLRVVACEPVLQLRTHRAHLVGRKVDVASHLKHPYMRRCAF